MIKFYILLVLITYKDSFVKILALNLTFFTFLTISFCNFDEF